MSHRHRRRQSSHRLPGRTAGLSLRPLALTVGVATVVAGIGAGVAATHPGGNGTTVAGAGPASDSVASSASPMAEDATPTSPSASASKKAFPLRTEPSGTPSPRRTTEARATASESAATRGETAPSRTQTRQAPVADGETARVLELVNQERAKAGCSPLTADPELTAAAEKYSDVMAGTGTLSHTGPDGSQISDRVEDEGYAWSAVGENIAQGQPDADAVMDAWMNSPGHRQNILNCDFEDIGIGLHEGDGGPWWTQDFGTPR